MMKKWLHNKYVRLLFMSLVIILALIFVSDFAEFLDENSNKKVKFGSNQSCNSVHSICSASLIKNGEFQRISFFIKEFSLSNSEAFIELTAIGFDFEGIDSISVSFIRIGESTDETVTLLMPDTSMNQVVPEKWFATVKLPKINTERKDWLAIVHLKSSAKEYQAEFPCHF
ncbi:MAG: hypothetical protein KAI02_02760 [Gammaproteobacteria bacterium]|nr:hypothetical protein [Gammaproteobacteria bacterium]